MTMVEGDARVTIEFQLQIRRKVLKTVPDTSIIDGEGHIKYTQWRTAFTSTEDDVMVERDALLVKEYDAKLVRVIRVTTIEEVWKL
jgi:hypothetical protein